MGVIRKLVFLLLFAQSTSIVAQGNISSLPVLKTEPEVALNSLVSCFETFLKENYKNDQDVNQIRSFLMDISTIYKAEPSWKLDHSDIKKAFELIEKSGLRIEMYLIGEDEFYPPKKSPWYLDDYESTGTGLDVVTDFEDVIEFPPMTNLSPEEKLRLQKREKEIEERRKRSLNKNINGDFLFALAATKYEDTTLNSYLIGVAETGGNISPIVFAKSFMKLSDEYLNSWIGKVIITHELFYPILHARFYEP